MIEFLFWLSAAAIIYTYAGYPLIIWLLARLRTRPVRKASITPTVSVVLACHNEERNLERRIQNLFESDYTPELLEVIIVCDGSTDSTAEIAGQLASLSNRVRSVIYDKQQGKAVALNAGVAMPTETSSSSRMRDRPLNEARFERWQPTFQILALAPRRVN